MNREQARVAKASVAGLAALLFSTGEAPAQIIGSCTITVQKGGMLAVNPSIDVLGSSQAGGDAAVVTVASSSLGCAGLPILDPFVCYGFSAPPPAAFVSAPAGGGDNVGFASTYAVDGGPPVGGATETLLANGSHSVAIDLTATRATGIFPAGDYQARVTVRCE